jgi:hypothetical protein
MGGIVGDESSDSSDRDLGAQSDRSACGEQGKRPGAKE